MRCNSFPDTCQRCWQHIPANEGVLGRRGDRWTVSHEGDCPPYPGGYTGPTWVIDAGEPGTRDRQPRPRWTIGVVLRADIPAVEHPVPEDSPGRCGEPGGRWVSLIVTVLAEAQPRFVRDEDGNSPDVLIGENGWWFRAKVRPATAAEAAPLLAEESVVARRRELERRRVAEFAFGYSLVDDGEVPDEPDLSGAVAVPFGAEALRRGWPVDRLLVDQEAGVVWSLTYNQADGEDWSRNNTGPYVAWRQPLTPRRAELIRDLREEYELDTWTSELRIEPAAARALLHAGWDYDRARVLACFALSSKADVAALLARPREDWEDAGWLNTASVTYRSPRVPPADASRLADAGISHSAMCDLRTAGHATVEQQIAATPPDVPDSPGRIILRAPDSAPRSAVKVTSDPELARHWLSTRRTYWWPGRSSTPPAPGPSTWSGPQDCGTAGHCGTTGR
ncbi:hypothetical protein [Amycolatopsis sp. MJM2582]|uniref:hypothetical protein n=1 Tax=Amycolatopsis sp. MJM2582 TaxID=1427749 RepID=UPI00068B2D5A|nr:hypothetical protein [Amycolatopsis sp. MJM2582]